MVRAYELGVPELDAEGVGAMRAALDRAAAHAAAGELIEALAGIHAMHGSSTRRPATPSSAACCRRSAHASTACSTSGTRSRSSRSGRSYRHDLVAALERGEPDEAVEIMRRAWGRFRDIVAAREDEARP